MYPQYRDMMNKTDDPVALAFGKILRVCIMHRVTDIYGPIPYSKMMDNDNSGEDLAVAYDSQEQVYTQMLKELEEADKVLEENKDLSSEAFRKLEDLYYGNISKWRKFVHSMQLRIAMRMSYVNPTEAQRIAQKAVEAGVIESNEDNAMLHVAENRSELLFNNWNDYRISADLVSIMKGYEDPRLDKMFVKGVQTVDQDGEKVDVYDYYGVRIGIFTQKKDDMINLYSKQVISSTDPYLWMNAAEVTFLRAEGALRGWNMGGDAQALYEKAIALSFEERGGATGADQYVKDAEKKPIDYVNPMDGADIKYSHPAVSTITIAWEPGASISNGTWSVSLLKNGLQYSRWGWKHGRNIVVRATRKLLPAVENKDPNNSVNVTIGPRRLPFLADEYTGNPKYIDQAVEMLNGPDAAGTKLWWDKKDHSIENSQSSN